MRQQRIEWNALQIYAQAQGAEQPFSTNAPGTQGARTPPITLPDAFRVAKLFANFGNSGSQFSSIAPTLIIGSQPLQPQQADQFRVAKLFANFATTTAQPVIIPTPPTPPIIGTTGPTKAIVYSLDRQVFEPIQVFPEIIRSLTQEAASAGTTWNDLPNPWSTYVVAWDTFPNTDQIDVFFGTDGTGAVTWNDLPNPWNTYNQSWNSFPAGGDVHIYSANSSNDNGVSIPYSFTPVFFVGDATEVALLDSWEFFLLPASNFELTTILFEALTFPLATPTEITASFVVLNDPTTYAIPKALPTQNAYSRYIKMTLSGESFYRAFAFGGGTVFMQVQKRPSR